MEMTHWLFTFFQKEWGYIHFAVLLPKVQSRKLVLITQLANLRKASGGLTFQPLLFLPPIQTIPPSLLPTSFSINTSVCCLSHSLGVLASQHCYLCTANMPDETKFKCTLIAASTLECVGGFTKRKLSFLGHSVVMTTSSSSSSLS